MGLHSIFHISKLKWIIFVNKKKFHQTEGSKNTNPFQVSWSSSFILLKIIKTGCSSVKKTSFVFVQKELWIASQYKYSIKIKSNKGRVFFFICYFWGEKPTICVPNVLLFNDPQAVSMVLNYLTLLFFQTVAFTVLKYSASSCWVLCYFSGCSAR